ncbi:carboxymuconolactone decarboxylase family protein [Bradyrhizobium sp. UFLA05-153]
MQDGKTRIPPVDVETCPDDLRETLEEQRKLWGAPLYPYLFYARHPPYLRAAKKMWAALQEEAARVPDTLRALVNRRVAWSNGCEYCQDAHAAKASRLGVSTDKIDALNDYARSPLFSEAERVALEYADAITETRRDVDDELFSRLQRHYDDDTIAELTMIIAWQNASSRFNHAFRIPSQGFWTR